MIEYIGQLYELIDSPPPESPSVSECMPELTGWAVRSAVGESGFHQPLLFNSHLSEEQLRRVFLHTVGLFNCL